MKRKGIIICIILAFVFFATCDNNFIKPEPELKQELAEFTHYDFLALMHLETNLTRSSEELVNTVQEYLALDRERGSYSHLAITGSEPFSKTYEIGFKKEGKPEQKEIVFQKIVLENSENGKTGYVITCSDERIVPIIAVVPEGDWEDTDNRFLNVQKAMLDIYILQTIATFNNVTKDDIKVAQEKLASLQAGARYITYWGFNGSINDVKLQEKTRWKSLQNYPGEPYNWAVDYCVRQNASVNNPNWSWTSGSIYAPGEDVIALAQLVAFHEYAGSTTIPFVLPPISYPIRSSHKDVSWTYGNVANNHYGYRSPSNPTGWINFTKYGVNYDWINMLGVIQPSVPPSLPNTTAAWEQVATLVFQMGCRMNKNFTPDGSSIVPIELVANALYEMGYKHHGIQHLSSYGYYITEEILISINGIMRSIDDDCPVYVTAYNESSGIPYTAWLITGYSGYDYKGTYGLYITVNTADGGPQSEWFLYYEGLYKNGWNVFDISDYLYNLKFITGAKPLF